MYCCACNGSCCHTGPCHYCDAHSGKVSSPPGPRPHPAGVCPNCGYCPTCGRKSTVAPSPWSPYEQPYIQPWTTLLPYKVRWGDVTIGDPPGSLGGGVQITNWTMGVPR